MLPVGRRLPSELGRPDVRAGILRALQQAYEENQDRHDPEVGDDALTFGIHLWKSGAWFLAQELAGLPGVTTAVVNQSLEVRVGRCRLRLHKLGDAESDDPERSFPRHVGPAARLGRVQQLRLEFDLPQEEYLDWVIGHYGSPDEGLRAIRLQAVGSERSLDGTISQWEAIETLFDVGMPGVPVSQVRAEDSGVVVVPEPKVTRRRSGLRDLNDAPA